MIIYRLEHKDTGVGPFVQTLKDLPTEWLYSHDAPMDVRSPCHDEYMDWIREFYPEDGFLPVCMKFGFNSLQKLLKCFTGYRRFPGLQVMEYQIDTSYREDYCVLSDGQVIFSEVISKTPIDPHLNSLECGLEVGEKYTIEI